MKGPRGADYHVDPATGCWVWAKHVRPNGYGQVGPSRRAVHSGSALAHRVYYEAEVGPVPAGLELDHLCQRRSCVNPAHLEAVTRSENMLRGRCPLNAKLTPEEVREIRLLRGLFSLKDIAERFDVSVGAVKHIHYGQRWSKLA